MKTTFTVYNGFNAFTSEYLNYIKLNVLDFFAFLHFHLLV